MAVSITEIRQGNTFEYKGDIFRCVEYNHIKWAQQARIRLKMKNLRTGAIIEETFNVGVKLEKIHIEYRPMQYLYNDGEKYHFMDQETFNQIELKKEQLGGTERFIKEGFIVNIAFHEEEALDITLPASVDLKVTETTPEFKGNTVSGGKPATVETGYTIPSVPFFTKVGDVLKVDTRDGKYLGRS
ncbi:elongation factor P [candidate division WOR-1 bacterium RIFOXYC2_FULL_37_10]|uniref:Elongation factor P n=1 Tax=candidate division WOR-1 bacterium RIFOXYB2_FULL_37_13 TaxID=1802579 RepID=A0A1F4SWD7_UNCSA|nr:MAG: elongation factor P [candidate division WOR-1 bacterium RIFOXYA2_FULL_37_7]OGC24746.1 MAG: elongation factor P [candidate division WOR-1 bacterium RIFOXYB2_FULL_37_13]OGC34794.1 MAG: elongation factor P [candidate division WOR-1 bacterium RIFOXYC2_FULL_37_10]